VQTGNGVLGPAILQCVDRERWPDASVACHPGAMKRLLLGEVRDLVDARLIQCSAARGTGFTATHERSQHSRVSRLTTDELRLIAQALRYLSNVKITDSLGARSQNAQELQRAAARALALAERIERATTATHPRG
jgi:hypothetical protein